VKNSLGTTVNNCEADMDIGVTQKVVVPAEEIPIIPFIFMQFAFLPMPTASF
jgi:hypothetical protein